MKITIVGSRGIPARYGGFETYADKLSNILKDEIDVRVVNPHHYRIDGNDADGVRILYAFDPEIYFNNRYARAACTVFFDLFAMIVAIRHGTDAILVCGYASGPCLFLPRLFGVKVFVNPDGFEWKSSRWNAIVLKWLLFCEWCAVKASNSLICDSRAIGKYFENKFGDSVVVIEYGAEVIEEPPALPEIVKDYGSFYLACARMVPETKIHEIIDGFVASGSNKHLVIVGPVKDQAYFDKELAPRLTVNNVIFLGPIYEEGVLPAIRFHALALLHGHASDGTNPSLIESMGCGSPVLAIRRESNIFPLTLAYEVFWGGAVDLAELIVKFEALSESQRGSIGDANRQRIIDEFSWEKSSRLHMRVLCNV